MSNIILGFDGLEDQILSTIDEFEKTEAKKLANPELHLSIIQLKAYYSSQIIRAIISKDASQLKYIIDKNSDKSSLEPSKFIISILDSVTDLLFEHFDSDVSLVAVDAGLVFTSLDKKKYIISSQNPKMVSFFINQEINLSSASKFSPTSTDKLVGKYDRIWMDILSDLLLSKKALVGEYKDVVENICCSIPSILNDCTFRDSTILYTLLIKCDNQSSSIKSILSKVNSNNWHRAFTNVFSVVYNFKEDRSLSSSDASFALSSFGVLLSLINDNPHINNAWNKYQTTQKSEYKQWKDWYDEYLPEDADFSMSPLISSLSNLCLPKETQDTLASTYGKSYGLLITNKIKDWYYVDGVSTSSSLKEARDNCISVSTHLRLSKSKELSSYPLHDLVDNITYEGSFFR